MSPGCRRVATDPVAGPTARAVLPPEAAAASSSSPEPTADRRSRMSGPTSARAFGVSCTTTVACFRRRASPAATLSLLSPSALAALPTPPSRPSRTPPRRRSAAASSASSIALRRLRRSSLGRSSPWQSTTRCSRWQGTSSAASTRRRAHLCTLRRGRAAAVPSCLACTQQAHERGTRERRERTTHRVCVPAYQCSTACISHTTRTAAAAQLHSSRGT